MRELPRAPLFLTLLVAALAVLAARPQALRVDSSVGALLAPDDPRLAAEQAVQARFAIEQRWLLAVPAAAVEAAGFAQAVREIHGVLLRTPGVRGVESLATAPLPTLAPGEIDTRALTERMQEQPLDELLELAAKVGSPLVSADRSLVGFAVVPDPEVDPMALSEALRSAARGILPGTPVRVAGASLIETATAAAMRDALASLLPKLLVVAVLLLALLVRRIRVLLLCLLVASGGLVWTLAAMAGAGLSLNLVTALLPPLLLALGIAYGLYAATGTQGIALAAVTTAAGFLALLPTPVYAVRQFAVFAALGVLAIWAACLLLGPLLREASRTTARLRRRAALMLSRLHRHRRLILAAFAGVTLLAAGGIARIESGTELGANLPPDAPVLDDWRALNTAFGGLQTLHLVVDAGTADGILEPSVLHALDDFTQWLREQRGVARVSSLTDTLRLLTRAFGDGAGRLPDSAAAAKQYLWLGGGSMARSQVDQDYAAAHIAITTPLTDTAALAELRERIMDRARRLPPALESWMHGQAVLLADTIDAIATGQLPTLAAALGMILLALGAVFMSLRAALLALVPNAVPIVAYFGALGHLGISLSPATSLVACIVIGLAVDNTIHYFSAFNRAARSTGSERRATRLALREVLGPASTSSVLLIACFLTLATGGLPEQARFGLMAAATLAFSWLSDMLLTPVLASRMRIVTFWDLLTIDLGESPERTLPLMQGLSRRQARTLAVLLSERELGPGEVLLREGEIGEDFYLVIDGELSATVTRDGDTQELARLGRGALIGEAGFVGQPRSATVRALKPSRLLRMDSRALEHLRRRHPAIAAVVWRNLHRTLAQRFADNLRRLA